MLCWYFHEKVGNPLDIAKILKFAIAHDFVEVYTGDVNTCASEKDRAENMKNKRASLARLSDEFTDFNSLIDTMQVYEDCTDEESRFVWKVDKKQALIMGDMDGWRPYQSLNISYAQFVAKYSELLAQSSTYCRQLFSNLIEYSKTTYYDRSV